MTEPGRKRRVLVVDDSAVVSEALRSIISAHPSLEVMACVNDPLQAAERLRHEIPDVIILDVEMPRMDGLIFLRRLMSQHPIPVVMCSSLLAEGSKTLMEALEAGAVDIVKKPQMATRQFLEDSAIRIQDALIAAARARVGLRRPPSPPSPRLGADLVVPATQRRPVMRTTQRIVAVGASTGGTEALRFLLESMPGYAPPIVIVQHMPEQFTSAFADRLNGLSAMTVREARDGDRLIRGQALIAPGNRHLVLQRSGATYFVEVRDGPPVNRHRPSVDVLFRSVAAAAGGNAIGIILTGMGDDGARGLREMRDAGARTLGQNEASCVVYGMPKEAKRQGGVEEEVPLADIPKLLLKLGAEEAA
ncbi:chemotaxis response regulator protein-glutamate methylesterase [Limibaculum sp. FT325]|uniref:protein-glutamate methylesterase/protein-glutamine glutaminase n=1 Tax=Thermohalobaculum sediminis TaxID=2939436 RepID=UPI0020C109BB|nr:chemotaxis response regulator protein-glutamate methylesterase [Limibaculum sediminis]MCL5776516.1 chemotaxis response regulator protein-glutamate methylesterase [Limibaculum sediminis]